MSETALRTENITVGYGGPDVLKDVSLQVPEGKITALLARTAAENLRCCERWGVNNQSQRGRSTLVIALSKR